MRTVDGDIFQTDLEAVRMAYNHKVLTCNKISEEIGLMNPHTGPIGAGEVCSPGGRCELFEGLVRPRGLMLNVGQG